MSETTQELVQPFYIIRKYIISLILAFHVELSMVATNISSHRIDIYLPTQSVITYVSYLSDTVHKDFHIAYFINA